MHASVCAPTTTSRPTPRPDSTVSRVVSSKESPYSFSMSGSASAGVSSGTIRQSSLLLDKPGDVCDDRVANVSPRDDAVLHVDDEERGVRPFIECRHKSPPTLP